MDGVIPLNNILVIGVTACKELVAQTLLRPGRLQVQLEIRLPDEAGRRQILDIHTATLRERQLMHSDVTLDVLAKDTKNFSGAELAGLVMRSVKLSLNEVSADDLEEEPPKGCLKMAHFESVLRVRLCWVFSLLFVTAGSTGLGGCDNGSVWETGEAGFGFWHISRAEHA